VLHHEYETIVIVRPDVEESGVAALAEKFEGVLTEQGGHILDRENWGSRKLAYPIAKHLRGHFIRMNYLAGSAHIAELERKLRIEDGIIRFMTVRLADAVDVPTRIEEAAVHRAQREEEERRRAEEQAERERLEAERAALEGDSYDYSGDRERGGDRERSGGSERGGDRDRDRGGDSDNEDRGGERPRRSDDSDE